jgi:acetylornithine deacetylase/succinyl-diaminopimelate desuccinylase-like protein
MSDMTSDLTGLRCSLVASDAVNPSVGPGGAGEAEIATFIEAWTRDAGLDAERLEETTGRPSVLVRARGTGGDVEDHGRLPDAALVVEERGLRTRTSVDWMRRTLRSPATHREHPHRWPGDLDE